MRRQAPLQLEVQLMDDPCLWRWDIRDPSRAALVASSWWSEWMAYPSAEEAYQAGRECLRALEAARPNASAA